MISPANIQAQLDHTLKGTSFHGLGEHYAGKVRDTYRSGERLILVASDRLSAFDRIITTIPFKGQALSQISQFWFEQTKDIVGSHIQGMPDPNVTIGTLCKALPVEMVVRGYITGVTTTSAWYNYERGARDFCGNKLPEGMKKNQKFDKPIITPSTKAAKGSHDESVSPAELFERTDLTKDQWEFLADVSMKLYMRGVEICAKQGIILVDTKYEFGVNPAGKIVLIDEIHTPDSSRFWFADEYEARLTSGEEQKKIDKEYLREWLAAKGFVGEGEIPAIPDDVRAETARRYIEAYELITGRTFEAEVGDPLPRIEKNLAPYFAG